MHFGDFQTLCSQVPSYTWCNLFYRQVSLISNCAHFIGVIDQLDQVLDNDATLLTGLSTNSTTAPMGVNPECGIPLVQTNGSLGNVANIIACGLSVFVVVALIVFSSRRKAAVGTFSMLGPSSEKKTLPCTPGGRSFQVVSVSCRLTWIYRALRTSYIFRCIPSNTDIPNPDDWLCHSTRYQRPGHSHRNSCRPGRYSFLDFACECHRSDPDRGRRYPEFSDSAFPLVLARYQSLN